MVFGNNIFFFSLFTRHQIVEQIQDLWDWYFFIPYTCKNRISSWVQLSWSHNESQFSCNLLQSEIIGKLKLHFKNPLCWWMSHELGWQAFTYSLRRSICLVKWHKFCPAISLPRQKRKKRKQKDSVSLHKLIKCLI